MLTSVTMKDEVDHRTYLDSCPNVWKKYAAGKIPGPRYTAQRLTRNTRRWNQGIPFAELTAREKEGADKNKFVGRVVMGGGDEPNSSEQAVMLAECAWNKGYGAEITGAMVLFYAPEIYKAKSRLPNGELFQRLINTVRVDNIPSLRLGLKVMRPYKETNKWNSKRFHLELGMEELVKATQQAESKQSTKE